MRGTAARRLASAPEAGGAGGARAPGRHLRVLAAVLTLALAGCASRQASNDTELGLEPESSPSDVYIELASQYLRLGQPDIALRRARQAVETDKKSPRAHYVMAVVFQRIGQFEQADESFRRALELAPNNSDILNAYGGFHCSNRRWNEAQAQFSKALENPIYTTPWVTLTNAGTCASMAGDSRLAETRFREALARNPRFGPALLAMADVESGRGNAKLAKEYMDRYFQSNPATPYALAKGVRVERTLGNKKSAATYEQLLKQHFPSATETLEL